MKIFFTSVLLIGSLQAARAVEWYVATNGTGQGTGGWADATNNFQGAINASIINDTIWVSNGVYDTGGTAVGALTNRIVINKSITVRSKDNDPANTIIKGAWNSPSTTNGAAAIRCVYMASNSWLIGFTLTNGATLTVGSSTRFGGGIFCTGSNQAISNCLINGNSAFYGGGCYSGTLYNCIFNGNTVFGGSGEYPVGAGAYGNYLYNCTVVGNVGGVNTSGSGVTLGVLSNCAVIGNMGNGAGVSGSIAYNCSIISNATGGASGGTLYNCVLSYNGGGGASGGTTLYNSILTRNTRPGSDGGGANGCILYNCLLAGNTASWLGGGAKSCVLYNCTVIGNYTSGDNCGGGLYGGTSVNCIVYFNGEHGGASNWWGSVVFLNSCTAPTGTVWSAGDITSDPKFIDKGLGFGTNNIAGNYRLTALSPCINAGTNFAWMTDGSVTSGDLDGRQRLRYWAVDMGAYENIRAGTIYGFR